MRGARLAVIVAASSLAFTAMPLVAQERAKLFNKCWTRAALASRASERIIRSRIRRAYVAAPKSTLSAARPTAAHLRGSIRRVKLPKGKKLVALTFDLCEAGHEVAGYDGGVIDYLRAHNIKATLFVGGKWLMTHPRRAAQLMADPRFELGNHSWSHANARKISTRRFRNEVAWTQAAYSHTRAALRSRACARSSKRAFSDVPARMKLYRFPYGTCSKSSLNVVAKAGLLAIQWDVVTGDPWRRQTADRIAKAVLRTTKPGSIIVAHANGRGWNTSRALAKFVPKLRARGYKFVTVGELLKAGKPVIAKTCYEVRPGDNRRYDLAVSKRVKRKKTNLRKTR